MLLLQTLPLHCTALCKTVPPLLYKAFAVGSAGVPKPQEPSTHFSYSKRNAEPLNRAHYWNLSGGALSDGTGVRGVCIVVSQEDQVELTMQELRRKNSALDKYVFLQSLQVCLRIVRRFSMLGRGLLLALFVFGSGNSPTLFEGALDAKTGGRQYCCTSLPGHGPCVCFSKCFTPLQIVRNRSDSKTKLDANAVLSLADLTYFGNPNCLCLALLHYNSVCTVASKNYLCRVFYFSTLVVLYC